MLNISRYPEVFEHFGGLKLLEILNMRGLKIFELKDI